MHDVASHVHQGEALRIKVIPMVPLDLWWGIDILHGEKQVDILISKNQALQILYNV